MVGRTNIRIRHTQVAQLRPSGDTSEETLFIQQIVDIQVLHLMEASVIYAGKLGRYSVGVPWVTPWRAYRFPLGGCRLFPLLERHIQRNICRLEEILVLESHSLVHEPPHILQMLFGCNDIRIGFGAVTSAKHR